MAERDPFELDLAAALRAYAEDAPTEVRPVELAHEFATAYPHRRTALPLLRLGWTPAMAWVLLLAGLLLALVVGGLVVGARRPDLAVVIAPSPSSAPSVAASPGALAPILSLPTELQGSWSAGSTIMTLGACGVGDACGRIERVDDNYEHCVYTLTYRSGDAEGVSLATGTGNSFGCAWSPWASGVVRLTPKSADRIEVVAGRVAQTTITLTRGAHPSP